MVISRTLCQKFFKRPFFCITMIIKTKTKKGFDDVLKAESPELIFYKREKKGYVFYIIEDGFAIQSPTLAMMPALGRYRKKFKKTRFVETR